jgi:hypothetical protein
MGSFESTGQSTNRIAGFEDGHLLPGPRQVIGGCHPANPRAEDSD